MFRVDETAFAKINLDLRVCERRANGYHDLDSLVVFAEIGDKLTFEPGNDLTLAIKGPFQDALPNDEGNLVMHAARALAELTGLPADARITLDKILPIASGLGGGSADAAATLRGLCRLWGLSLGLADLAPLAMSLGADVPACLRSTSVRMQGLGDRLSALPSPGRLSMVLVNPGKAVSTPDVFRRLTVHSGARDPVSIDEAGCEFRARLADSVNDLEAPAIRIAPVIGATLEALRSQPGCTLAHMSGSGATCFGLFDDSTERERAVSALSRLHPSWWITSTEIR